MCGWIAKGWQTDSKRIDKGRMKDYSKVRISPFFYPLSFRLLSVTYPFADRPFSVFGSGDKVLRRTLIWIVLGQRKRETNDDRPKLVIPCWPAALFIYNLRLTSFLGSNCIDWDRLGLCLALELKGCTWVYQNDGRFSPY